MSAVFLTTPRLLWSYLCGTKAEELSGFQMGSAALDTGRLSTGSTYKVGDHAKTATRMQPGVKNLVE